MGSRKPILAISLLLQLTLGFSQQTTKSPQTNFSCRNRAIGYYADTDSQCQAYHMCDMKGNKFSYLCPNGTLFHQQHLICAHHYQVNCDTSTKLYEVNRHMFPFQKFPTVTNRIQGQNSQSVPTVAIQNRRTETTTTTDPETSNYPGQSTDFSEPVTTSESEPTETVLLASATEVKSVKFPRFGVKKFNVANTNVNCPQCNPYFLKGNSCSPCVTIR